MQPICRELITENFVATKADYHWLCEQVNIEYSKLEVNRDNPNTSTEYDYFKTFRGKLRLKIIKITKKYTCMKKSRKY